MYISYFILTQGFSVVDGRFKMFSPKIRFMDCIKLNIFICSVGYRIFPLNIIEHYINIKINKQLVNLRHSGGKKTGE